MVEDVRLRLSERRFYYGWIIVFVSFLTLYCIYSINYTFGVFFDYIVREMDATRASASLVFSVQTVSLYVTAATVANFVNRIGSRRLVVLAAVLIGSGMGWASQANSLSQLYLSYGVVTGAGMGFLYVIGFTIASKWFDRRRGVATAIATSGVGFATLVGPPVASFLIDRYTWKVAYVYLAGFVVGTLVLVAVLIADSPRSVGVDASSEFSDGLPPIVAETLRDQLHYLRAIVTTRSFGLILLAWFGIYLPVFTLVVYIVTYATEIGMARRTGVLALSVLGGMTIVGRIGLGTVADRTGRFRTFSLTTIVLALALLVLPMIRTPLVLIGFAAVYGILYGGTAALASPLLADFYGSENVTTVFGVSAPAFGLAALGGPYLAGVTFSQFGTYEPFFQASALAAFLGSGSFILAGYYEGEFSLAHLHDRS